MPDLLYRHLILAMWLAAWLSGAAIGLVVLNSLLWGAGLSAAWHLARMAGSTQGRP
jgi:hypothetical protein